MSVEDFFRSEFSLLFEGDDRAYIASGIESGAVVPISGSTEEPFRYLDALPHTSRLLWEDIPHIGLSVPADTNGVALDCKIDMARSIGGYFGILESQGILFEDMFSDFALKIALGDVLALSPNFFESAGHKYLLGVDRSWLFNFTMEEQFYFSNRLEELQKIEE